MKKEKIFLGAGLIAISLILSGCGNADTDVKIKPSSELVVPSKEANKNKNKDDVLPEAVSVVPGANADEEIKNIDNDLKSLDDASLTGGMTDSELGM